MKPQGIRVAWVLILLLSSCPVLCRDGEPDTAVKEGAAAVIIIPARIESTRFPRKPLAKILGVPMIIHTLWRCRMATTVQEIRVATDSEEIRQVVESYGGRVVMTSSAHETGTDRVSEALDILRAGGEVFEIVINVQGDEPCTDPTHIDMVVDYMRRTPGEVYVEIGSRITSVDAWRDRNVPKIVVSQSGHAMYMSRSPVPYGAERTILENMPPGGTVEAGWSPPLKAEGLYGLTADFLRVFATLKIGHLQRLENIEQIKVLEHGYRLKVLHVDWAGPDVNIPADVGRVERWITDRASSSSWFAPQSASFAHAVANGEWSTRCVESEDVTVQGHTSDFIIEIRARVRVLPTCAWPRGENAVLAHRLNIFRLGRGGERETVQDQREMILLTGQQMGEGLLGETGKDDGFINIMISPPSPPGDYQVIHWMAVVTTGIEDVSFDSIWDVEQLGGNGNDFTIVESREQRLTFSVLPSVLNNPVLSGHGERYWGMYIARCLTGAVPGASKQLCTWMVQQQMYHASPMLCREELLILSSFSPTFCWVANDASLQELFPTRHSMIQPASLGECAVVGNGGRLWQSGHGKSIDSADFVVRLKEGPTEGFQKDVGSRTDVRMVREWAVGESPVLDREYEIGGFPLAIFVPDLKNCTNNTIAQLLSIIERHGDGAAAMLSPAFIYDALSWSNAGGKDLWGAPSIGFLGILWSLRHCRHVTTYGIGGTPGESDAISPETNGEGGRRYYYWEPPTGSVWQSFHSLWLEDKLIQLMSASGAITRK